jgi:hypothetical protein
VVPVYASVVVVASVVSVVTIVTQPMALVTRMKETSSNKTFFIGILLWMVLTWSYVIRAVEISL